jgi:hypothetical protein
MDKAANTAGLIFGTTKRIRGNDEMSDLCKFQEKQCPIDKDGNCIREPLCKRIAELEAENFHLDHEAEIWAGRYDTATLSIKRLNAQVEQYEQSLKHLWQWLPLMYRHDYLKDYPAEKEILQGNRIRGNDD